MRNGPILFSRRDAADRFRLHVVEADGTGIRPWGPPTLSATDPEWSPDGSALVCLGRYDPPAESSSSALLLLDAEGTTVQRLSNDHHPKLRPAWSPDGSEIVFERSGRTGYHLHAIDVHKGSLRQITGPPEPIVTPPPLGSGEVSYRPMARSDSEDAILVVEEMPSWSPDSETILFVRPASRTPEFRGDSGSAHHIWACATDGTDQRQVTEGPVHDMDPAFSPDGSLVAFTRYIENEMEVDPSGSGGRQSAVRVFLMRPDGSGIRRLTEQPGGYMAPCWAPGGTMIACSSVGPNGTRIVVIDVQTGTVTPVTSPTKDGDYSPTWRR